MTIPAESVEPAQGGDTSAAPFMAIEEARAKLARAKGVPDLAVMVKAFEGYDGPEICGDPALSF